VLLVMVMGCQGKEKTAEMVISLVREMVRSCQVMVMVLDLCH
jgi:hypothetical protein